MQNYYTLGVHKVKTFEDVLTLLKPLTKNSVVWTEIYDDIKNVGNCTPDEYKFYVLGGAVEGINGLLNETLLD